MNRIYITIAIIVVVMGMAVNLSARVFNAMNIMNPVCISPMSGVSDSIKAVNVDVFAGSSSVTVGYDFEDNGYDNVSYTSQPYGYPYENHVESNDISIAASKALRSKPERAIVGIVVTIQGTNVSVNGRVVEYDIKK